MTEKRIFIFEDHYEVTTCDYKMRTMVNQITAGCTHYIYHSEYFHDVGYYLLTYIPIRNFTSEKLKLPDWVDTLSRNEQRQYLLLLFNGDI